MGPSQECAAPRRTKELVLNPSQALGQKEIFSTFSFHGLGQAARGAGPAIGISSTSQSLGTSPSSDTLPSSGLTSPPLIPKGRSWINRVFLKWNLS